MMKDFFSKEQIDRFYELISAANEVVILSHTNPDGDAVGSVVAMKRFLVLEGKKPTVIIPNRHPDYLSFLDPEGEIIVYKENKKMAESYVRSCDLILALDFNQLSRIDDVERVVRKSLSPKVLIDHHPSPEREPFDLVLSETEISSNCELLYWLFSSCKERAIPVDVAEPLYVGMMTDTNNFANSVLASTFRMASDLIGKGVDKEKLQHLVFGGFSESRMRLMGYLLSEKMTVLPEMEAGFIMLSKEDQEKFSFAEGDSEGFVNIPLSIKGINISALFTESEGVVRVSLRSANDFSVNKMARRFFNGGGHERASGGKLFIPFGKVADYFVESLTKSIEEYRNGKN
ncbi:MAG: DHH family phosphoesterase [Bacteroidales bacterium]|nr:DHH family phosphoesterase [Bacteroidales bacterium]